MKQLMLYGPSGCGKTTLATIIAKYGYIHVNTGDITRLMAAQGCHNLPVIVQTMIDTMDFSKSHVFDHFYMHTWKQLNVKTDVVVIEILDVRKDPAHMPLASDKRTRWFDQDPAIRKFITDNKIEVIKVYNTDYGFDVSELIRCGLLPFDAFPVEAPR